MDSELSKLRNRIDYEIERCIRNGRVILEAQILTMRHCTLCNYCLSEQLNMVE